MGVKPLFYAEAGGAIYFASEPQALLTLPDVPHEPDPQGLDAFFSFGYVPAPLTGYRAIKQLLPGEFLLREGKDTSLVTYWDLPLEAPKIKMDERECAQELDRILKRSVERQMISDVPLGVFLSGGTDSFAVVRAMLQNGVVSPRAFTIGFPEKAFDESELAGLSARALGVEIQKEVVELSTDLLEQVASHCFDPFADSSCLPTYVLCRLAAREVKVALSGDGADELLGGYPTHRAAGLARLYRLFPSFVRQGLLRPLASWLPESGGKYTLREKALRFTYGAEQGRWRDHALWRVLATRELKQKLYTPEFLRQTRDFDPADSYAAFMRRAESAGCSELDCLLYADTRFYLPNDMLVKVDRMSMAHGLEVRVPFLGREMVDFCWRLPDRLKIKNGRGKHLLRRVINDSYPLELQARPKSGFNAVPQELMKQVDIAADGFIQPIALMRDRNLGRYSDFLVRYALFIYSRTRRLSPAA